MSEIKIRPAHIRIYVYNVTHGTKYQSSLSSNSPVTISAKVQIRPNYSKKKLVWSTVIICKNFIGYFYMALLLLNLHFLVLLMANFDRSR